MEKRYISITELSQYLNVPVNTIRWWVWQRKIPFYKFGSLIRFNLPEIEKWSVENRREEIT